MLPNPSPGVHDENLHILRIYARLLTGDIDFFLFGYFSLTMVQYTIVLREVSQKLTRIESALANLIKAIEASLQRPAAYQRPTPGSSLSGSSKNEGGQVNICGITDITKFQVRRDGRDDMPSDYRRDDAGNSPRYRPEEYFLLDDLSWNIRNEPKTALVKHDRRADGSLGRVNLEEMLLTAPITLCVRTVAGGNCVRWFRVPVTERTIGGLLWGIYDFNYLFEPVYGKIERNMFGGISYLAEGAWELRLSEAER